MYLYGSYREPVKKSSAAQRGKIVLWKIAKVINTHFPTLNENFEQLVDPRVRKSYTLAELLTSALFVFIFKEGSRNLYNSDRRDELFRQNFFKVFKVRLSQADTFDALLRVLPPNEIEHIKAKLVSSLFEQKLFREFRFLGKYYHVAVDATGISSYEHRHCPHCLTKTSKHGTTTYFHYVLEAKLVTSSGLSISLASEFIENTDRKEYEKQDCEQKAFVRLASKIKKFFPRLPICLLADGLYPNNTVFDICQQNNWLFIITLKDGSLKSFNAEANLLKNTAIKQTHQRADSATLTTLDYAYLNDLQYGNRKYSWIECCESTWHKETKTTTNQRFVYITNIIQKSDIVVSTIFSGRLRWKIENEGFNELKNNGYELQHKYSRVSYPAMQNYYHILQIAHAINQLVEKTNAIKALLKEYSKQTKENLWRNLLAYMAMIDFKNEVKTVPD